MSIVLIESSAPCSKISRASSNSCCCDCEGVATVAGGLQTVALLIALAWLGLRRRDRMEAAGSILLSLVAVLIAVSMLEPPSYADPGVESLYVALHLALIFLGMVGYAVSFALSALFLLQRHRLKKKLLDPAQ